MPSNAKLQYEKKIVEMINITNMISKINKLSFIWLIYAQKKKFSQYRHCVQLFCRTVFILTKTLPNMKFI